MNFSSRRKWVWFAAALLAASVGLAPAPNGPATQPATQPAARMFSPVLPGGANVALIKIDGMIYDFVLESLKSRVDKAVQGGASLIVIELDTNGGLVSSALDISRYIKSIPVPTVAWVNSKAYSAGILIASSCNAIVMSPSSATGDCAPIVPGQNLAPTERAKALSPILTEFRDNARRNGYDYTLFHAMCELGVEIYEIENPQTGEHRFVNQADYEVLVRGASVDSMRSTARGTATTAPDEEALGGNVFMPEQPDGETQRGAWKLVRQVHDGRSLLTVHQTEAIHLGLSRGIVKNEAELKQFLNASSVTRIEAPMVEAVAYWLTRGWVRAILMVILLVGGYFEMQAPGVGIGAIAAAVALVLLVGAPFLVGMAGIWQVLLFALGFGLLMLEIFVFPTVGLLALIGIIMMFIGLVLMVVPTAGNSPISLPAPEMWRRLQESLIWTMIGVVFSGVGFFYVTRYFGHLPFVGRLVLKRESAFTANGPERGAPAMPVSGDEVIGGGRIAPGAAGRAVSQLRPSGRADIDGRIVDVVTLGSWIEAGTPIRVVEIAGNRIVVDREMV